MLVASLLPHGGDRVIAFIDFVKSLRWPAVAALLVLQLDPIRRPIESLRGNGAGVVRLGDIACRVTPHALPQPNEDIVRAVAAMDGDILRTVLNMDQNAIYCGSPDVEYRTGMRRPAHLELVEAWSDRARPFDCRDDAVMAELGKWVKTYLISVMVGMLKG
jgi:hypothetical protein